MKLRLWNCMQSAGLLAMVVMTSGCIGSIMTSMIKGGEMIDANYKAKILVSYREDGVAGSGEEISLVETPAGPAMLGRMPDGTGLLFKTHWRDEHGDHFAMYIGLGGIQGPGYEYIVPLDRRKNAVVLQYDGGTYEAIEIPGQAHRRPLPRPAAYYSERALIPK